MPYQLICVTLHIVFFMKNYVYLNGDEVQVPDDTCRGCYLEQNSRYIPEIIPIWENNDFTVRQDVEFPIPGFYIVSARKHINTFADLSLEQSSSFGIIVRSVRKAMREALKINRVHIFLEERRIEPHLHLWLLPLWEDIMSRYDIDPKIYNSNVAEYLHLFKYEDFGESIIDMNKTMRFVLSNDPDLQTLIK